MSGISGVSHAQDAYIGFRISTWARREAPKRETKTKLPKTTDENENRGAKCLSETARRHEAPIHGKNETAADNRKNHRQTQRTTTYTEKKEIPNEAGANGRKSTPNASPRECQFRLLSRSRWQFPLLAISARSKPAGLSTGSHPGATKQNGKPSIGTRRLNNSEMI